MEPYVTTIANREAIFTEDGIKVGYLVLPFDKMSNVKFRKGGEQGFIFDYEGRNVFIPCSDEEKGAMMPFFSIVALKDRERHEEEERRKKEEEERRRQEEELRRKQLEEQDALDTLDFLTVSMLDPVEAVKETKEETPQVEIENTVQEEPEKEQPQENPMTDLYEPSGDSPYYDGRYDNNINQNSFEPDLLQLEDSNLDFTPQEMQQNIMNPENIPLDIIQSVKQPEVQQQKQYQIQLPSDMMEPQQVQQNSNLAYQPNKIDQQSIPVNQEEKPNILKSFWSVGRLVMGILAILACAFIVFQSYKYGAITILLTNKTFVSHVAVNLIIAVLLLIGGIIGIITHKSTKKLSCILPTIMFAIGAGLGGYEWNNNYNYVRVWAIIALFFTLFYLFCSIRNPRKKKV